MLQHIRDRLNGVLAIVIVGAISLVFIMWGAAGFVDFGFGNVQYAAKVNGEKIPAKAATDAWQRQQMMWQQRFGGELPVELKTRMQDELLEAMVSDALLQQHARKLGYRVNEEELHKQIQQVPQFQVEGKYSPDAARYALASAGMSEQEFEVSMRRDLERRQIEEAIRVSNFLTPAELKRMQSLQAEQREVRFLSLAPEKFASQAVTDDAAIQAYYTKNQARFMTSESVRLAYGELRLDQLASQIVVTDDDIKAAYEKNKVTYVKAERRQARHILIETGKDDVAAKKKAQEVLAEANAGKDFAELAKKYSQDPGSAQKGGDLGFSEKGSFDPVFDDAEFGMKAGEIRGPVKSAFGYHIIKLETIEPGHTRTLAEARSEIESQVRRDKAADRFGDVQEKLQQKLEQQGADFDALVREFNLQAGEVAQYKRGTGGAPLGDSPELDQAVFSSAVLEEKRTGGPVALGEERIVIVKALEHRKPQPKALAVVRDDIVKSIRDEFGRAEAAKAAQGAQTKLTAGMSFDDVVKELGMTADAARFIGRDDPSVPAAVRTSTFDAPKPAAGKSVSRTVKLDNGATAVLVVSGVRMDPNSTPQLQVAQQRELMGRQGQGDAVAYLEELRRTADVSKNLKAFQ